LWWLFLSASFLWKYWQGGPPAGADGSAHVAILHLYAKHAYPSLQGWLPEFFGGMPFPIFYPPLFYWLGATLMKTGGISAEVTAKLLKTASFAALPSALFVLGRRLGLMPVYAAVAAAAAGVIACGSNIAALSGVGLLGLFEVGLYTQTLGFVFMCLWFGALPFARRSRAAAAMTVLTLTAMILSSVHVLLLAALYGVSWLMLEGWRIQRAKTCRGKTALLKHAASFLCWVTGAMMVAGIWLVPLLKWYSYSVGRPLKAPELFLSMGAANVIWPVCALVAWLERHRRPALSALCVTLLLSALAAMTPLGGVLKFIPFQPWRIMTSAILLSTIPFTLLCSRLLREVVGKRKWVALALTASVVALATVHPGQRFGIATITGAENAEVNRLREAVKELPPGMLLTEIVQPDAIFNSSGAEIRELAISRALNHQIAMDGRPILWSVFREHAVSAPFATAVNNLFSSHQERFGIDGLALHRASANLITTPSAFRLARHLGVSYYLISTPEELAKFDNNPEVRLLWTIDGWNLYTNNTGVSPAVEEIRAMPVLAWLPAHFKNRSPDDFDFFNLGEQLACDGHPEISVIWASSAEADPMRVIRDLSATIIVIDPSAVTTRPDEFLSVLTAAGSKLRVILIDDGSPLANRLQTLRQSFAAFEIMAASRYQESHFMLDDVAKHILAWQELQSSAHLSPSTNLWRLQATYFPAWEAASEGSGTVFLTGQGETAVLSSSPPVLRWSVSRVQAASITVCLLGIIFSVLSVHFLSKP